jgi:hypothetical protein
LLLTSSRKNSATAVNVVALSAAAAAEGERLVRD